MMKDFQKDVLDFWFVETDPKQWFQGGDDFDQQIITRFKELYERARDGDFDEWQDTAEGVLALCILLDQMPRNMFRGTPAAFATDNKALKIAKKAVEENLDQSLSAEQKTFLYLPFEHSENLDDQHQSVALFEKIKDDNEMGYDYALRHLEAIEKFDRFPHRNKILGRNNTPAEEEYLSQPGAGF